MSRPAKLQPFEQGHLDGLCGLYALINAARLAVSRAEVDRCTNEDWEELFHVLLAGADDAIGAVRVTANGIKPKPLYRLAKLARRHMADQHGVKLEITRPFKGYRQCTFEAFAGRLRTACQGTPAAMVVCLNGHLDHWTVLERVSATTLELLDSDGLSRVKLANCRLAGERSRHLGRQHIIRPKDVLQIRVVTSKR